ncbi:hypothetical protein LDK59_05160 [Melissococcus plutonius]|uniref:hypothetical protein n=2 Tax=Melissococcus plutonius TaxID=33970 RepID=UPI0021E5A05F|nr:hypothetical protein [Melissococcus plutonius]
MKKITWSVLIGVAFCLLLTGCNSEKKADTSTSSAKKEIKSSTSKNNDKENEKKAKKDKEAKEAKEKAEKVKQAQIAQKVKEADTAMKQAEATPTDATVSNAKATLSAIPGGNPDLQKRLDAVNVALNNAKQQVAEQAQAAQVKKQEEQAQATQEQAKKQVEQTQSKVQANANNMEQENSKGYKGCTTLTDFVNKYGMSPAAYKMQYEGMSEEEALRSTMMKTSGEVQLGLAKYGINP